MQNLKTRLKSTAFIALVAFLCIPIVAGAEAKKGAGSGEKPGIVLIHGAFADGSCWQEVIPILQHSGYKVTAAQLPLTSFNDDIAFAKRLIDAQKGQVVVVGHSYGGAVISEAAAKNSNVKALVFVAAFALDNGESANDLLAKFLKTELGDALVPDAAGFLYIDREKFHSVFAQDLPKEQAATLAAVQKPIMNTAFAADGKEAAWKSVPSWYIVTKDDHALNPNMQRFLAKRMSAHVSEVKSGHLPMLSLPKDVAKTITEAAMDETAMATPK